MNSDDKAAIRSRQTVISAKSSLFDIKLAELFRYRDLITLFITRDFISQYKQTILGPAWFMLQPLLTTLIFVVIFGNIAKLSTDGLPKLLFYLSGTIIWSFFSFNITQISDTFLMNKKLFSKVYFPRLAIPFSLSISNLLKFGLQFIMFVGFLIYYAYNGLTLTLGVNLLLLPLLILLTMALSIGIGLIFASLTAKYRDLRFALQFFVQLLMYATPIIYPLSIVPEKYAVFIWANPVSAIVETFRKLFFGGAVDVNHLLYASTYALVIFIIGILFFNHRQKTVIDVL